MGKWVKAWDPAGGRWIDLYIDEPEFRSGTAYTVSTQATEEPKRIGFQPRKPPARKIGFQPRR